MTVDPTIVSTNLAFWTSRADRGHRRGKCRIIAEELETFYDGFAAAARSGPS